MANVWVELQPMVFVNTEISITDVLVFTYKKKTEKSGGEFEIRQK